MRRETGRGMWGGRGTGNGWERRNKDRGRFSSPGCRDEKEGMREGAALVHPVLPIGLHGVSK